MSLVVLKRDNGSFVYIARNKISKVEVFPQSETNKIKIVIYTNDSTTEGILISDATANVHKYVKELMTGVVDMK
jgi:hypothetical protein